MNLDKITNILGNGIEIQGFYGISLEPNRMDSGHTENMQLHEGPMLIATGNTLDHFLRDFLGYLLVL